ncbi:MAG: DNA replication/repair protein RecF [Pseudomonadota bacterium]|nr:DNA replication/repair protein RecF [Pseudomonadota bacterium]
MKLSSLAISGVRNIIDTRVADLGDVNIFTGLNGAGKTSVLEAVYILGLAKSFRGTQLQPVVNYLSNTCTVFGELEPLDDAAQRVAIGVKRAKKGGHKIRVAGKDEKSLVRLAELLPLQLINSMSYLLLEGGPKQRRQFIDWGVFHVEQEFYSAWRRMQRSLKQRNGALRSGQANNTPLAAWDNEFVEAALIVDAVRQRYFESFESIFYDFLTQLLPDSGLDFSYERGWTNDRCLEAVLKESKQRDLKRGFTHYGPHRADLKMTINGLNAGQVLSRGQQKLVVCALKLAQCQLMIRETSKECILLVDDLPAEIDHVHQAKLCRLLDGLNLQLFMTCVEAADLSNQPWSDKKNIALFELKKGEIIAL